MNSLGHPQGGAQGTATRTGPGLPPPLPGQRETSRVPRCGLGTRPTRFRAERSVRGSGPPTGMAVSARGRCFVIGRTEPCGDCLLTDSIETSTTDHLTLIEDIAMTSAVLILALSGLGGLHGPKASGQCPPAPSKCMPSCQAPCKSMPSCQAPTKCAPTCAAPSKCMPTCQAPTKCAPKCAAPSKCMPTCQAPSKCAPSCQAPSKCAPSCQAPGKVSPQG
jgi:hypothetical protein